MGIEPTRPAWKAGILPLNYTRKHFGIISYLSFFVNTFLQKNEKKPQKNKYPKPRKKVQFRASFFQKGIDFFEKRCIIYLLRKALRNPREWRNWQTRTFEGRVDNTVRVQVPFPAPNRNNTNPEQSRFVFFFTRDYFGIQIPR